MAWRAARTQHSREECQGLHSRGVRQRPVKQVPTSHQGNSRFHGSSIARITIPKEAANQESVRRTGRA